jgi:hypothetical protein
MANAILRWHQELPPRRVKRDRRVQAGTCEESLDAAESFERLVGVRGAHAHYSRMGSGYVGCTSGLRYLEEL